MTEPADSYRSLDPTAPPLQTVPIQPPAPPGPTELETSMWSRPNGSVSSPPASGPPGYPATLPVPYPPAPAAFAPPQSYQPYPPHRYGVMGTIGYGSDPLTGQPFSSKSKVAAGVLQLLPGFLFCLGGIGRLYAGNTSIGVLQLVATLVGWVSFWCGFALFFPFLIYAATWLWFVIDGVVMLAGRPVDGQGWPLRP